MQVLHEIAILLSPKSGYMYYVHTYMMMPRYKVYCITYKGCCNERKASGGQYGHSALQLLLFIIRATFFLLTFCSVVPAASSV